jgi:hypothetical protein
MIYLPYIDDEYDHASITSMSLDWELRALAYVRHMAMEQVRKYICLILSLTMIDKSSQYMQLLRYRRHWYLTASDAAYYCSFVIESEKEVCVFWVTFISFILSLFDSRLGLSSTQLLVILHQSFDKTSESLLLHSQRIAATYESMELAIAAAAAPNEQSATMASFFSSYPKAWQAIVENIQTANHYLSLYIVPFIE